MFCDLSRRFGHEGGFVFQPPSLIFVVIFVLVASLGAEPPAPTKPPASVKDEAADHVPEQHSVRVSLDRLRVRDGWTVEALVTEPWVVDPVSARIDGEGTLWVVEMPDYPTGPRDGSPPAGRVLRLRDSDGDGQFDHRTVFADGLMFPTGVQPYRDGAFVTVAGELLWLRDADGDGIAEHKETLFVGFATENEQLRANHPTLGPDGRIYVAGGLRGGQIQSASSRFPKRPHPLRLLQSDFGFDPAGGWWDAVEGNSQFGLTIDDFGRRIGCSNRNPAMTSRFGLDVVRRHFSLAPRDAVVDVAAAADASIVKPLADAWTTSHLHAGQFSAACGVLAPGSKSTGNDHSWLWVCEPTGSLVQRQALYRTDEGWRSEREPVEAEFLASTDDWFRPVDLSVGPNGSILVVDMARAVIEHPDWVPEELKRRPDTWFGNDLGRIWILRPTDDGTGTDSNTEVPKLTSDSMAVEWISSTDPWRRTVACRRLHETIDAGHGDSLVDGIHQILESEDAPDHAVARATWLLSRQNRLSPRLHRRLLESKHDRIRRLAVRRWHRHPKNLHPSDVLTALRSETSPHVAVAWFEALGRADLIDRISVPPQSLSNVQRQLIAATTELAVRNIGVPSVRMAVSAMDPRWLSGVVDELSTDEHSRNDGTPSSSHIAGVTNDVRANRLTLLTTVLPRIAFLNPVGGLARLEDPVDTRLSSATFVRCTRAWLEGAAANRDAFDRNAQQSRLTSLRDHLRSAAADRGLSVSTRRMAVDQLIRLSRLGWIQSDISRNDALLSDSTPIRVRVGAAIWLAQEDRQSAVQWLRTSGNDMPGSLTTGLIDALSQSAAGIEDVLNLIRQGVLSKTVISVARANRWKQHKNPQIAEAAEAVFASAPDRLKVIESYRPALGQSFHASAGKKLFETHCAGCHRIDGIGQNVGPDISDSRTKTPESLLVSILDPNAAIDAAFRQTIVLTSDGRVIDGLLVDETGDAITLLRKGGDRQRIVREQIEEMRTPGVSLMPEGFERSLSVDEMADLIGYLKSWRYLDSDVPAKMETVSPGLPQ